MAAEFRREMTGDKRVIGLVRRQAEHLVKGRMVQPHFGIFRQDLTKEGAEAGFARGAQAPPGIVRQDRLDADIL